jgi:hypothetical protein
MYRQKAKGAQGLPVRPKRLEPMPKMSLYKIAHRRVIVWTASISAPSFKSVDKPT